MYNVPVAADFKALFTRDFPYGTDPDTTVLDSDINRAITDTSYDINENLFETQAEFTAAFLLLAAHHLVMNLRASSQGIAGSFAWLTASKGVSSVSESYSIPTQVLENPYLAVFSKTNYGAKYLLKILPRLTGGIAIDGGGTNA